MPSASASTADALPHALPHMPVEHSRVSQLQFSQNSKITSTPVQSCLENSCPHDPYVLSGHCTTISTTSSTLKPCKALVVKLSQQAMTSGLYVGLTDHFKNLRFTSDDIQEHFVSDEENPYETRVLRCIVPDRSVPLSERLAVRPKSIKTMVRQILTCVHDLRYKAHILHRDVSDSNIMWTERNGQDCFILHGFDRAVKVDPSGTPLEATSRHRTGTMAFVPHELLLDMHEASLLPNMKGINRRKLVVHCVRMDFESTVLVAIWSAIKIVKNGPAKLKREAERYENYLKAWECAWTYESMALVKLRYLQSACSAWKLPLSPLFSGLRYWFMDLLEPFHQGFAKRNKAVVEADARALAEYIERLEREVATEDGEDKGDIDNDLDDDLDDEAVDDDNSNDGDNDGGGPDGDEYCNSNGGNSDHNGNDDDDQDDQDYQDNRKIALPEVAFEDHETFYGEVTLEKFIANLDEYDRSEALFESLARKEKRKARQQKEKQTQIGEKASVVS